MESNDGYITTDAGIRLFFQKVGSGSRTVVIPNATYMFEDFKYLAESRTVIFYDLRNRGRSDSIADEAMLKRGVHNDVADLEAIRLHFELHSMDVIGHSYLGIVVALYAMKYPLRVNRVVQICPPQPDMRKQYPPHLTGADATMAEINARIAEVQKESAGLPADEMGRKVWSLMRSLYVTDPADTGKIHWSVAHLPNESFLKVMTYFSQYLLPSFASMTLTARDVALVQAPILIVHGTRDRQAPYGGGMDWALLWPNARLLTVENAAHLPWIESPDEVFGSVRDFLDA